MRFEMKHIAQPLINEFFHVRETFPIPPLQGRGRDQRPLRQGQGLLRRPGAGHAVVAHEAAETFAPPHDALGRADDGKMTNQRNEHEKKLHRQSQW